MSRLTKHRVEAINGMGGRIRDTLKRCDPALSDSLRLTIAGLVKEAMRKASLGHVMFHPGMAKIAQMGGVGIRQARRNCRELQDWGVLVVVGRPQGGGRFATRYWMDCDALIQMMVALGANPHPDLIGEIRDMVLATGWAAQAGHQAGHQGGQVAGHMSAGSYDDSRETISGTVVPLRAGGRHA